MNTCPKCGARIEGIFCPECGYKLEKTVELQNNAATPKPESSGSQTGPYHNSGRNSTKANKSKKTAILAVIVGVLLLGIGAVLVFGNMSSNPTVDTTKQVDGNDVVNNTSQAKEVADSEGQLQSNEDVNNVKNSQPEVQENAEEVFIESPEENDGYVTVIGIEASSVLDNNNELYGPQNAIDNNPTTAWVEGVDGNGIRQSLTARFDDDYVITGIEILPGYLKSEDLFYKNAMPISLSVSSNNSSAYVDISSFTPDFNNITASFFPIDTPVKTDNKELYVTIMDARSGNKYQDTCISELRFVGHKTTSSNEDNAVSISKDADDAGVHTYSLIVENATWDEAYARCINMGGHLVRITSDDEWQAILRQIQAEGKDKIKFWIGAKRDDNSREYHWVYGNDMQYGDEIINTDPKYQGYWLDGEPSFYDESTSSYEDRVNIFYVKRASGWIWNDVPNDVAWIEFYNGSMGYICEFE